MQIPRDRIEQNLAEVRERIAAAADRAGRRYADIRIIAVTKGVGFEEVQTLHELGITEFGENRVEIARAKIERLNAPAKWHMIGNVQRRKCPDIVRLFDCVDAVDRLESAQALDKRRLESGGDPLPILIEVNASGEASKHGFSPEELTSALDGIRNLQYLTIEGLMTMAPFVDDPKKTRPAFASLKRLADAHGLNELSMGMTNDYEVAIEEGATQVRIGSALFR